MEFLHNDVLFYIFNMCDIAVVVNYLLVNKNNYSKKDEYFKLSIKHSIYFAILTNKIYYLKLHENFLINCSKPNNLVNAIIFSYVVRNKCEIATNYIISLFGIEILNRFVISPTYWSSRLDENLFSSREYYDQYLKIYNVSRFSSSCCDFLVRAGFKVDRLYCDKTTPENNRRCDPCIDGECKFCYSFKVIRTSTVVL